MIRIRNGSNSTSPKIEEYFYDYKGQRVKVKKYDSANTTIYTPFRELLVIKNNSGFFNFTYVYKGEKLVARVNPDNSKYFYHSDHLGSTSLITNISGGIVESTSYDPFGNVLSGGSKDKKLYTGQFKDNIDQYYYGARYYKPTTAQFVMPDIIVNAYDPKTLNHYAYAKNNPYKYVDTSGNVAVGFEGYLANFFQPSGVRQIADQIHNENPSIPVKVFSYDQQQEAQNYIEQQIKENPNQPIIIYGHSLGGVSALDLSKTLESEGLEVDEVYTIDPVDLFHFIHGDLSKPDNVKKGINYYQRNSYLKGNSISGFEPKDLTSKGATHPGIIYIYDVQNPSVNGIVSAHQNYPGTKQIQVQKSLAEKYSEAWHSYFSKKVSKSSKNEGGK